MNKSPVVALSLLLVLLAGAAGVYYYRQYIAGLPSGEPLAVPQASAPALPEEQSPPPIIHLIPDDPAAPIEGPHTAAGEGAGAEAPAAEPPVTVPEPLPALDESDAAVLTTLGGMFERRTLEALFNLDGMIRRVVMTVDNLPRNKLSMRHAINQPTSGRFLTLGKDDEWVLDPANYDRYTPFVRVLEAIDSEQMVSLYVRFYPLFQQAYEELGYPSAYFNDRLVAVIDHLLAAPDIDGPIALRQPHVFYTFADPELEALSAGQKLLLRMGPANAARIKARLRELRERLATGAG